MIAAVATDNGGEDHVNVEYKFRCYNLKGNEVPSLSSPWRNLNNVSGTFPNGVSQVERPHEYWAFVGLANQQYRWTVQYRDMATPPNYSEESALTPLQN
jgi:hypothetical protein